MAMSADQEKVIAELHAGVKAAPANDVANDRSQLLLVLEAVDAVKGSKSAEQSKAIEELRANVKGGASVVANSRATLLAVFDCLESLRAEPKKSEPKV